MKTILLVLSMACFVISMAFNISANRIVLDGWNLIGESIFLLSDWGYTYCLERSNKWTLKVTTDTYLMIA